MVKKINRKEEEKRLFLKLGAAMIIKLLLLVGLFFLIKDSFVSVNEVKMVHHMNSTRINKEFLSW
ncbi:MAG: hypothetical protein LRY36_01270 [Alphaproteobacteria bacterium]|nr:hypothetical protein [Alphaproteobacteria bacterium]